MEDIKFLVNETGHVEAVLVPIKIWNQVKDKMNWEKIPEFKLAKPLEPEAYTEAIKKA